MPTTITCNGVRRRDFLKAGVIGGTGLTLANYMKFASAGEVASKATANAAIFINLTGGPTHMDTFDLKPEAKAEYRGEFDPIDTAVPGIQISEHLPKLAQNMHLFTILRGVTHTLGITNSVPSTSTPATARCRPWSIPATARSSRRNLVVTATSLRTSRFPAAARKPAISECSTRRSIPATPPSRVRYFRCAA